MDKCSATITPFGPPCALDADHAGVHVSEHGTWRDGNYLHGRTHGDLIRELYQRISKLEDRMSPPVVRGPEPNEDRPCTAVLKLNGYTERTCDAGSHQGPHRDPDSGDIWEQYQEGAVQVSRPRYEELVRRSSRLTALENPGNPVCGHRDPSSGRVCQRPPGHPGEVHSDTPRQFDAVVWSTGHGSAEHRAPRKPETRPEEPDTSVDDQHRVNHDG